jgi:hypothetical protein
MQVCVINNCGRELHNCTGRLFSNSPEVDCILDSTIDMADFADSDEIVCIVDPFRWKLADVSRNDVDDIFEASFNFTMTCDELDALSVGQSFSLALDLDLEDHGQTPQVWLESFESGDLASSSFFAENLDAGIPGANNIEGHFNGDGWRCQYHDPDLWGGSAYGNNDHVLDCYPGMSLDQSNAVWWQSDGIDTGSPDGGRAKSGNYSMYYGAYLTEPPGQFTTPLAAVESVATKTPINLGVGWPELSWWHQINIMDWTNLNTSYMTTADRGVVQYKTVDLAGDDTSFWMNLQPYQNTYDQQAFPYYYNCSFDPVDDGTTEDDYFDPTDPNREFGPSSTCYPEFIYACLGDTDDPFQVENICNATTQPTPADQGSLGTGTWVQSKVDLSELRGRRIHLRFLVSSLKGTGDTYEEWFQLNPSPEDDGWWIDDVTVDETLSNPVQLIVDDNVVRHCTGDPTIGCLTDQDCIDAGTTGPCTGEAPQCPETCTSITAQVATTPDETGGALDELLAAPGQPIELAASSSFGTCVDGALQFRFSADAGATAIREYSENPVLIVAPQNDTDYLVEVRCSTDTACDDAATVDVDVACPSSGNLGEIFPTIIAADKTTWMWTPAKTYLLWQGSHTCRRRRPDLATTTSSASWASSATTTARGPPAGRPRTRCANYRCHEVPRADALRYDGAHSVHHPARAAFRAIEWRGQPFEKRVPGHARGHLRRHGQHLSGGDRLRQLRGHAIQPGAAELRPGRGRHGGEVARVRARARRHRLRRVGQLRGHRACYDQRVPRPDGPDSHGLGDHAGPGERLRSGRHPGCDRRLQRQRHPGRRRQVDVGGGGHWRDLLPRSRRGHRVQGHPDTFVARRQSGRAVHRPAGS